MVSEADRVVKMIGVVEVGQQKKKLYSIEFVTLMLLTKFQPTCSWRDRQWTYNTFYAKLYFATFL